MKIRNAHTAWGKTGNRARVSTQPRAGAAGAGAGCALGISAAGCCLMPKKGNLGKNRG